MVEMVTLADGRTVGKNWLDVQPGGAQAYQDRIHNRVNKESGLVNRGGQWVNQQEYQQANAQENAQRLVDQLKGAANDPNYTLGSGLQAKYDQAQQTVHMGQEQNNNFLPPGYFGSPSWMQQQGGYGGGYGGYGGQQQPYGGGYGGYGGGFGGYGGMQQPMQPLQSQYQQPQTNYGQQQQQPQQPVRNLGMRNPLAPAWSY